MGGMLRDGCTGGRGLYEGPRVRQPSGRKSARRGLADPRSWSVLGAGAGRAYDRAMNADLVTRIVVALERASVRDKVIGMSRPQDRADAERNQRRFGFEEP